MFIINFFSVWGWIMFVSGVGKLLLVLLLLLYILLYLNILVFVNVNKLWIMFFCKCFKVNLGVMNFVVLWFFVGSLIYIIDYGLVYKGDMYDLFIWNVL